MLDPKNRGWQAKKLSIQQEASDKMKRWGKGQSSTIFCNGVATCTYEGFLRLYVKILRFCGQTLYWMMTARKLVSHTLDFQFCKNVSSIFVQRSVPKIWSDHSIEIPWLKVYLPDSKSIWHQVISDETTNKMPIFHFKTNGMSSAKLAELRSNEDERILYHSHLCFLICWV